MTPLALKRLRTRLGLTQVAFAAKIGIAPNSLARIERGVFKMKRTTELAIKAVARDLEQTTKTRKKRGSR